METKTHPKFTKEINGVYIDPQIFTFKFSCKCGGECCNYGVYTDLKEHEYILSIKKTARNTLLYTCGSKSDFSRITPWRVAP